MKINKNWLKLIIKNHSKTELAQQIWDSMDLIEQQSEVFEINKENN